MADRVPFPAALDAAARRRQARDPLHGDAARARRSGSASSTGWRASSATGPPPASAASPTTPTCRPGRYRFHVVAYEMNAPQQRGRAGPGHPACGRISTRRGGSSRSACCCSPRRRWGAYRLHVRNLRRQFAAVLDERNRLAREMHDTLIQGCVGVSTLLEAASHAQDVSPSLSQRSARPRAHRSARRRGRGAGSRSGTCATARRTAIGSVPAVSQLAQRIGLDAGIEIGVEVVGASGRRRRRHRATT